MTKCSPRTQEYNTKSLMASKFSEPVQAEVGAFSDIFWKYLTGSIARCWTFYDEASEDSILGRKSRHSVVTHQQRGPIDVPTPVVGVFCKLSYSICPLSCVCSYVLVSVSESDLIASLIVLTLFLIPCLHRQALVTPHITPPYSFSIFVMPSSFNLH